MTRKRSPSQDIHLYEKILAEKGFQYIAGVDEVGRGCLAGPVLAAAVILPFPCTIVGINDSKKLSPAKRGLLNTLIRATAIAFGIGIVDSREIDEINILQATLKAMRLAIEAMPVRPEHLLIDGSHAVSVSVPQFVIPKGDAKSISVAAASIVAKVERDRMMSLMDETYPGFSFSVHKGYGTSKHLQELQDHGPTAIHRRSFKHVRPGEAVRLD